MSHVTQMNESCHTYAHTHTHTYTHTGAGSPMGPPFDCRRYVSVCVEGRGVRGERRVAVNILKIYLSVKI